MPSNKSSSSRAPGILRRWASQPERRQSAAANPTASLHSFRRQSTQERLDEVLETARERVDTMSSRETPTGCDASYLHSDDSPDETTSIVHRQSQRSYQSTRMKSDARNERATAQAPGPTDGEDGDRGGKHWLREYLDGIWTIELENKGSVARDHLALERTFLAWLRTSLAFASIGIAITQLFRLNTSLADDEHFLKLRRLGKPLGTTFLTISALVLLLGYQRYIQSQRWVLNGKFPASRGTIILVTLIALLLMVASLVIVVIVQPDAVLSG